MENFVKSLDNVCRTCMTEQCIGNQFIELDHQNMELLQQTVPKLEFDNCLPKVICPMCVQKILECHKFQTSCLEVQQQLHKMLKEQETLKQNEIPRGHNINEKMCIYFENNFEHCTPSREQLKPAHEIRCQQPECESVFNNQNNYEMHLERHHKLLLEKPKYERLFYCPEDNCIYKYGRLKGKNFKNLKYLKQHYIKVHLAKDQKCEECDKAFATPALLRYHQKMLCGKKFVCGHCQCSYDAKEALITHSKRKGHSIEDCVVLHKEATKKVQSNIHENQEVSKAKEDDATIARVKAISPDVKDYSPPMCKILCATSVQTDSTPIDFSDSNSNHDLSNDFEDIHSLLKDIETQTEPFLAGSTTHNSTSTADNHNYLDQMFSAQSSHMYTQTCDDFLSELGLADIQTQTIGNWATTSPQPHHDRGKLQFISTATSTNPCIHDELLVSTETQTSFTQFLLSSCTDTGTSTPPVSLYHTQQTQTCDPLLEGFGLDDFSAQDMFQSTYTQT